MTRSLMQSAVVFLVGFHLAVFSGARGRAQEADMSWYEVWAPLDNAEKVQALIALDAGEDEIVPRKSKACERLRELLREGAVVNPEHYRKFSYNAKSPLQEVLLAGRIDLAEILLAHGAAIDLDSAIRMGWRDLAMQMAVADPKLLHQCPAPLTLAAEAGDLEMVKSFLKLGADPNGEPYPVWWISFPLEPAVNNGHLEVVKCLIEHGAVVNTPLGAQLPYHMLDHFPEDGNPEIRAILEAEWNKLSEEEQVPFRRLVF